GWVAELSALTEPPLVELLKTGEVEWGFQWRAPWGIVEGQIDLWGISGGTVWVIDYKTGNSKFAQKALDQLQIYAHALRNHLKEDLPIKVAALFAADGRVAVADALTPDEVETKFQL